MRYARRGRIVGDIDVGDTEIAHGKGEYGQEPGKCGEQFSFQHVTGKEKIVE
jgi:hypothetical protein